MVDELCVYCLKNQLNVKPRLTDEVLARWSLAAVVSGYCGLKLTNDPQSEKPD